MTAPVKAVQTATFGIYFAGVWTASPGALPADAFDGAAIDVGDAVEINSLGDEVVGNGIFIRTADVSSRITFTRRSDSFDGGMLYGVLDGTSHKGSARQLLTPAPVTPGMTALLFGPVREQSMLFVDLTKEPYNVRSFASPALAAASGLDFSGVIEQFLEDSAVLNTRPSAVQSDGATAGLLPAGSIPCNQAIFSRGNANLFGQASGATCLTSTQIHGGPRFYMGVPAIPPLGDVEGFGDPNSTSVRLRNTPPMTFDLGKAGLNWYADRVDETPNTEFDLRVWIVPNGVGDANGFIGGTRGSRLVDGNPASQMHAVYYQNNGTVTAALRTLDPMNLKAVAGSGPAVTLSGVAVPSIVPVTVEILSSTTFRYSLNNGFTWIAPPNAISEVHTIPAPSTPYPLDDRARGAAPPAAAATFLNFPSGSYATGQTYSTLQITTLTSATTLSADGTRYEIAHTLKNGVTTLAINTYGRSVGSADPDAAEKAHQPVADPQPVLAAQSGGIVQFAHELTHWGTPLNEDASGAVVIFPTADVELILLAYSTVADTADAEPEVTLVRNAGLKFLFEPMTAAGSKTRIGRDGLIKGWLAEGPAVQTSLIVPDQVHDDAYGGYTHKFELANLTFDMGSTAGTALVLQNPQFYKVRHIGVVGGGSGIDLRGPDLYGSMSDFTVGCQGTFGFRATNCNINLLGTNRFGSQRIPLCMGNAGGYISALFIDNNGLVDTAALFCAVDTLKIDSLTISDESSFSAGFVSGGYPGGLIVMNIQDGRLMTIRGTIGSVSTKSVALVLAGCTYRRGRVLFGMTTNLRGDTPRGFLVTDNHVASAAETFVELITEYELQTPPIGFANRPEFFLKTKDKPVGDPIELGDASVTITRDISARFRMAAGVATGPRTITLSAAKMRRGQRIHIAIFSQTYTVTLANGGPGGGVLASGTSVFGDFVHNGTDIERY